MALEQRRGLGYSVDLGILSLSMRTEETTVNKTGQEKSME